MKALLSSELLKLRTLRGSWIGSAVAFLLSALIGVALVQFSAINGVTVTLPQTAIAPAEANWLISAGLAILATAGEFGSKTIRTTLLLTPRRSRVLLAKALVCTGFGGVLTALGSAAAVAAALITSAITGHQLIWSSVGLEGVAAAIGVGALWSVLAAGLGMIARSTAIAITGLLLWRFVAEGILPGVIGHAEQIDRWTPLGASRGLIEMPGLLPIWGAALLLAGYVAAASVTAAGLFSRRDPS